MSEHKLVINGELSDGIGDIEIINPATGAPFTTVAKASKDDAQAAIAGAKAAFKGWSKTSIDDRRAALNKLADAIRDNMDSLARMLTMEQGKPLADAQWEVGGAEAFLRFYTTLDLGDKIIQDDDKGYVAVKRKPLGVVAGIVAWNFPLLLAVWKIGPAVLAGNTIVLKPAPTTPVATLELGRIAQEVFPKGVVNVLADENELGPMLTSHPDVAKVAFTGSTPTGKAIMKSAADTVKRITLELGGNDVGIVLDDVDVPSTAKKLFGAAFMNNGQVCMALKRTYVPKSIYDDMCAELAKLAEAAVVDDGLKQGVQIGPIQNKMQFEKVKEFLEDARKEGTIVAGGTVEDRPGYFIRPTIVRDVDNGDRIVDEEQFGPIMPVIAYEDLDEVIDRANASEYGLGGSVWSSDLKKAQDVAERIESGTVWVNQHVNIGPHIPMAGAKSSGFGVEQSIEGLEEYTQIQVINVAR